MAQLFQEGQVLSAPEERQISICGIPILRQASPAPGFAHSYKNYNSIDIWTRNFCSPRAFKNIGISASTIGECPQLQGAWAKANTSGGRCHSRDTCTESPGCICFGTGSKDCHEQSSMRAALLPPVWQAFLSSPAQLQVLQYSEGMLWWAMEKQLSHRCSYLSCLVLSGHSWKTAAQSMG